MNAQVKPTNRYADLNAQLIEAVIRDEKDRIVALLREGASPNANTWEMGVTMTALMIASRDRLKGEIVNILLSAGAYVHTQTEKGNTALHYACRALHFSAVVSLLIAGACKKTKNENGCAPFQVIPGYSGGDFKKMWDLVGPSPMPQ